MPVACRKSDNACCPVISAGNVVSLRDALNGSHFAYLPLYHAGEQRVWVERVAHVHDKPADGPANYAHMLR